MKRPSFVLLKLTVFCGIKAPGFPTHPTINELIYFWRRVTDTEGPQGPKRNTQRKSIKTHLEPES